MIDTDVSSFEAVLRRARAEFPVPIADAVVEYEGTRDPHERMLKLVELFRAALRMVATCALAARLSVGPGPKGEDERRAVALLEELRRRSLTDGQWIELTRELLRPWRLAALDHPLPELVHGFDARGGRMALCFETLVALRNEVLHGPRLKGPPRPMEEIVGHLIPALEESLVLLAPVWARVRLVVVLAQRSASGVPLAWELVGQTPPRGRWRTITIPGTESVEAGAAILVNGSGAMVLAMSVALVVRRPSPGAVEETFFLDGGEKGEARYMALPSPAVLMVAGAWAQFRLSMVPEPEVSASDRAVPDRPYRGLESFGPEHAVLFVGRETLIEALANRVRRYGLVTVTGPSGAGKTSLLRAGIGPELARRNRQPARGARSRNGDVGLDYHMVYVRPGVNPWGSLLRALERELTDWRSPDAAVHEAATGLAASLRTYARERRCRVVLALDQAEELFTLRADMEQRAMWGALLMGLGEDDEGPTRVVLSLREDWISLMATLPHVGALVGRQVEVVNRPDREALIRVLVEPAERFGARYEEGLVDTMVDEVGETPAALALLQFTADRLWEIGHDDRRLTREEYKAIGGVKGSLGRHADEELARMTTSEQRTARELLIGMVTAAWTRSARLEEELIEAVSRKDAQAVLEKLTAARLVTRQDNPATVEIVHEALLTHWPRMQAWRAEDEEGVVWRARLREAVRDWNRSGNAKAWLWGEDVLAGLALWEGERAQIYGADERRFIEASWRKVRQANQRLWMMVAGVMAVLAGISAFATVQWRKARSQGKVASQREGEARRAERGMEYRSLLASARRLELDGNNDKALAMWLAVLDRETALEVNAHDGLERLLLWRDLANNGNGTYLLQGHQGEVSSTTFSPDGRRVVTASSDQTARVWEVETGRLLATLQGHRDIVHSATFSPDGRRVVTASSDQTARVWEVETGRLLAILQGHRDIVRSATFSPDGQHVVTASGDRTARVWEAGSGRLLTTLQGHQGSVVSAVFSPDSQRIVSASTDRTARIWDAENGRLLTTLQGHQAEVSAATFSPNGQRVATASRDRTARIWDVENGRLIATLQGHQARVSSAAFSPNGRRLVTASGDQTAGVWEVESGRLLTAFQGHQGPVFSATFSSDGQRVATASDDQTARVWEVESGRLLATLRGHQGSVFSATFSPEGRRVATASRDQTARVWEVESGRLLTTLQGHPQRMSFAHFSPDGQRIAAVYGDLTARVWEAGTGQLLYALQGNQGEMLSATFSRNSRWIVTTSRDTIARVWEARSGQLLATLRGGTEIIHSAAFSPDGRWIVTTSSDCAARVWETESGQLVATLQGHLNWVSSAAFSPDGQRVVTASIDRTTRIWNAMDGVQIAVLEGHQDGVTSAAYSPDGRRVVTASNDHTARVWGVEGGRLPVTMRGHVGPVLSAMFSPTGRTIATQGLNDTVRVWDADSGQTLTTLAASASEISSSSFSTDGQRIVTVSAEDGAAVVWGTRGGRRLFTFQRGPGRVNSAAFSPDGRRVVTASSDGTANVWDAVVLTPPLLARWFFSRTNFRVCRNSLDVIAVDVPSLPRIRNSPWATDEECRRTALSPSVHTPTAPPATDAGLLPDGALSRPSRSTTPPAVR